MFCILKLYMYHLCCICNISKTNDIIKFICHIYKVVLGSKFMCWIIQQVKKSPNLYDSNVAIDELDLPYVSLFIH